MDTRTLAVLSVACVLAGTGTKAFGQAPIDDFGLGEGGDATVLLEVWEPIIAKFYIEPESGASSVKTVDPVELRNAEGQALIGEWEAWLELKPKISIRSLKTRVQGGFYGADCVYAKDEQVLSGWRRKVSPDTGAIGFEVRGSGSTDGKDNILVERAEPRVNLCLDLDILTNTGPDDRAERIKKGDFKIVELSITAHKVGDDVDQFRRVILADNEWTKPAPGAVVSLPILKVDKGSPAPWDDMSHIAIVVQPMMGDRAGIWEFRAKAVMEGKFGPNDPAVQRSVEGAIRVGFKPSGFVPVKIYEERSGWRSTR